MKNFFLTVTFLSAINASAGSDAVDIGPDSEVLRCSPSQIFDAGYSIKGTQLSGTRLIGTLRENTFAGGREVCTAELVATAEKSSDGETCTITLKQAHTQDGRDLMLSMKTKTSNLARGTKGAHLVGRLTFKDQGVEIPEILQIVDCAINERLLKEFVGCSSPASHPGLPLDNARAVDSSIKSKKTRSPAIVGPAVPAESGLSSGAAKH
jgi:hypothetical protein